MWVLNAMPQNRTDGFLVLSPFFFFFPTEDMEAVKLSEAGMQQKQDCPNTLNSTLCINLELASCTLVSVTASLHCAGGVTWQELMFCSSKQCFPSPTFGSITSASFKCKGRIH